MGSHNDDERGAEKPPNGEVVETPHREGRPEDRRQAGECNVSGAVVGRTTDRARVGRSRSDPVADLLGVNDLDALREAVRRITSDTVEVGGIDAPATPNVSDARLLLETGSPSFRAGGLVIARLDLTVGDRQHGERMSDAHISGFRVRFRARHGDECPECGSDRLRRDYSRSHNIAGTDLIQCTDCGHTLHEDRWG